MRNSRLLIPENFADLDLLLEEARYFDITRKYPLERNLFDLLLYRSVVSCSTTVLYFSALYRHLNRK